MILEFKRWMSIAGTWIFDYLSKEEEEKTFFDFKWKMISYRHDGWNVIEYA